MAGRKTPARKSPEREDARAPKAGSEHTERKRAEAQLRESEERYRQLVATVNSVILSWDPAGTIQFINAFGERFFGFGENELVGRNVVGTIVPEREASGRDLEQLMREIQRDPDRFTDNENENITKDGRRVWVRWANKAVTDTQGKLVGILSVGNDITRRKRAEEAMAKSERLLQTIIETEPECVKLLDEESNLILMNRAGLDMIEVGALDDVKGQCVLPLIAPESRAPFAELTKRVFRGESGTLLFRMFGVKGRQLWLETHAVPLRDEKNQIVALLGVTRDVTQRKQAEDELWASRTMLSQVLDTMPQSVFWKDRDSVYLGCNQVFARAAGIDDPAKIVGKTDFDLPWPRAEAEAYRADDREVMGNNRPKHHIIEPLRQSDGSRLLIDTSKVPLIDQHGAVFGVLGVYEDVTERKRAEEKVRQSEEFVRSILETVDEGFILVDRDYRIQTANRAYCDQLGLSGDEVVGKPCFQVSHHSDRPCFDAGEACAVHEVFATGVPASVAHRHTDGLGRLLYVETKAYPVKDAAGDVVAAIETVSNITEKHLLEEERLKTQKLESIGTLAGGIAHDFNNLLQGIFGFITMAKLNIEHSDKALQMLGQAENALHQSVSLTTQLLTFSRGGRPVKKLIDLRPAITSAARFTLSGSRSDCRIDVPEDLWRAEADEGQLGQVIQNIVLNADQAMPVGGSVEIAARNLAAGEAPPLPGLGRGAYVAISIRDTGVGIPERYLERIFDPYFTTKEKGSGLGLATSYSIVRNHGGLIDVQTHPGEGSTFTIYLPAVPGEMPRAAVSAPADPSRSRPARILVMDDEEIIRNLSRELLGALGHRVEVAKDGQEALERYRAATAAHEPFDAVILDLTIRGGMGGAEALQKLREFDPAVKAIVSSGYSDDATIGDYLARGFAAYLKKPYNFSQMAAALKSLLQ